MSAASFRGGKRPRQVKAFHSSGPMFLPYRFVASVASFALTSGNNKCHRIQRKSREITKNFWRVIAIRLDIFPGASLPKKQH